MQEDATIPLTEGSVLDRSLPVVDHPTISALSTYPFRTDQDFLLGLNSILQLPKDATPRPDQLANNEDLVLKAQIFYLNRRYNTPIIDVEEYKEWRRARDELLRIEEQAEAKKESEPGHMPASPVPHRPSAPTPGHAKSGPEELVRTAEAQRQEELRDIPPRPSAPTPNSARPPDLPKFVGSTQPESQSTTAVEQQARIQEPDYPSSFSHIIELITENKPIPGIEEIPDTVLEPGTSKVDNTARRKKPWEKDNEGALPSISHDQKVVRLLQPDGIADSGLLSSE